MSETIDKSEMGTIEQNSTKSSRAGVTQGSGGVLGDLLSKYPVYHGRATKEQCVYFIQVGEEGPIKIGVASNVHQRLSTFQTAHYQDVRLLGLVSGGEEAEREWHKRFERHSIRGEWFTPHPEILDAIDEVCRYRKGESRKSDPLVIDLARRLTLARALDGRWHACLDLATDIVDMVRGSP